MIRPVGHRRFLSLARRLGGTDAELATILGTSASTVSRLRAGKTQKMGPYLERLEKRIGHEPADMGHVVDDLRDWSAESEAVRDLVMALHRLAEGSVDL